MICFIFDKNYIYFWNLLFNIRINIPIIFILSILLSKQLHNKQMYIRYNILQVAQIVFIVESNLIFDNNSFEIKKYLRIGGCYDYIGSKK